MGLDDELCRKARELYGWDMKFERDLIIAKPDQVVEISHWLKTRENVSVAIGCESIDSRPCYGFIDLRRRDGFLYQPFATVYKEREHDFQGDLLEAALQHLKLATKKPIEVTLPYFWRLSVQPRHVELLGDQEDTPFLPEITRIYREGDSAGITKILRSLNPAGQLPD